LLFAGADPDAASAVRFLGPPNGPGQESHPSRVSLGKYNHPKKSNA